MERHWRRPKYLAQNFLTAALQHRRTQLDSMLIVPPQHMEFIDSYVHCGWVIGGVLDGNAYDKPWQWVIQNQDDLHHNDAGHIEGLSCDNNPLHLEFSALISTCSSDDIQLEKYELPSEGNHKSENDECGSDVDLFLLSQDIDSAIDRFLPSSTPDCVYSTIPNDAQLPKEEFPPAKLNSWDTACSNDEDLCDHLVETPESPAHLSCLLTLLPTADDLVTQLKPKLIHDPLLDDKGQPFTHQRLFSGDLTLNEDFTQSAKCFRSNITTTTVHLFEQFSCDDGVTAHDLDCTDLDPILEICIDDDIKGETQSLMTSNEPRVQLPSPDKEFMNQLVEGSSNSAELWKLVRETRSVHLDGIHCERTPPFSPTLHSKKSDPVDFIKLNNHDVSHESDDSGLGHALLESPLLPPPLSPPTATLLTRQLAKLEPFPLSPGEKMIILSPIHKQKILLQLWERDKMFDTILALTLPYPDIEDSVLSSEVNTVSEALMKLNIKALKLDGDAELELTWDPLGESCHEMIVAEQSLISKQPFEFAAFITLSRKHTSGKWRESFRSDFWVKSVNEEGMEMPLSFHSAMREESEMTKTVSNLPQAESDIPSLNLGHRSEYTTGYQCKALPLVASNAYPKSTESDVSSSKEHSPKRLDPRAAAWEIIELSNSRIGSNSSAILYSSLRGNRDQAKVVDSLTATSGRYGRGNRQPFSSPVVTALSHADDTCAGATEDTVGSFMMLRFSGSTPERKRESEDENTNSRNGDINGDGDDMELVWSETVTSPSIHDVHLTGEYRAAVNKIAEHASSLLVICKSHGLKVPVRCSILQHFPTDSVKFFLKEQQKMLEDLHNTERAAEVFQSCQLTAGLFLVGTVLDMLTHCSLSAAIGKFTSLTEKYREFVPHSSLEPVREGLSELQTAYREHRADPHPKLREIMNIVRNWMKSMRKSWREKMVIVVEREFNTLSGDILDFLQVIPGLKSCVFSFSSNGHSDPLYAKAIEERFLHYDCVVVPESSVAGQTSFPWEKVTLFIEYEPLKQPLFDQNGHCDTQGEPEAAKMRDSGRGKALSVERLKLREYVTLKTAFKPSDEGVHMEDMLLYQYKLIVSENITNNGQLLQLLESKYNIVVVERDYYSHFKEGKPKSYNCSYADIIIDQSVGIILRPMSPLSADAGLKALISTTTALSFQFEACWILLYVEDRQQYPFSGSTPTNLARLHASVSHYSATVDCYQVKILIASGLVETAQFVRRIAEHTHKNSKVLNMERWMDRKWLQEEMTEREKILLTFPCVNSFSAQLMLDKFSLVELLAMDLHQLQENLPWLPMKILQLFHKISHISAMADLKFGGQFNEHFASIKPTQTADYDQPPKSGNPNSIAPLVHTSDNLVQHESSTLRDKSQHVRFNVYDLHSDNIENGLSIEDRSSLQEVIVLSSDEEEPPKPKRARPYSNTDTNLFPTAESMGYNHIGESDMVNVLPPSHHEQQQTDLNDSLEEFVMLPPLECPLGRVQSATSHDVSMDQHQVALPEPSATTFSRTLNQFQSNNGIYGDFSITIGDQNSAAASIPSFLKQDNLCNQSFIDPNSTNSSSNSAVNLILSTSWEGKTPTQKQIRESVMDSLADFRPKPGSYDPFPPLNNHVTNTVRMAREYFSGAPPPGFMAGAVVRKTLRSISDGDRTTLSSAVQRTPVKSLSLGHEDGRMIRLQSDDRAITVGSEAHEPVANYPHAANTVFGTSFHQWQGTASIGGTERSLITDGNNYSEIKGNYPNTGVNEREQPPINRFADLKAFHQLQHQPSDNRMCASLPTNGNFNATTGMSSSSKLTEPHVINDPWMGCGVIGPPARAKRPHPGSVGRLSTSHSLTPLAPDGLVPSASFISPSTSMDSSLYGSPNTSTGSIKLSPLQKRRLGYQRDPGSADGQTKLRFC